MNIIHQQLKLAIASTASGTVLNESEKSDTLVKGINKAMIEIDDSMSYEDFALAVGKVLRDDYGKHNYKGFMEVLHKDLGI
tara:strand:+ start:511 stop:753 length:243 start_codon:yes stop_codon:yes gene_type:complete